MPRERSAVLQTAFDGGSFLVVIPGNEQQEGQRTRVVIVTAEVPQRLFESFSAARIHAAVASPGGAGVVKAWPSGAYGQLVRVFRGHVAIEGIQVLLAPVAAILRPAAIPGMHPGVEAIEVRRHARVC